MGLTTLEGRMFGQFYRDERGRWIREYPFNAYMPWAKQVASAQGHMPIDALRSMAEIKYQNGKHGEGIVIRAFDQSWSFKVINLLYKD